MGKNFFKKLIFIFLILILVVLYIYIKYPIGYVDEIRSNSQKYELDPYLISSIINVESSFNPDARSVKDAKGLMQITPPTGEWIGEILEIENYDDSMLYRPEINIEFGSWYIKRLIREFDGDLILALAAYNAGEGNVRKWLDDENYSSDGKNLDIIPFEETRNYVKKVDKNYKIYSRLYKFVLDRGEDFAEKK